MQFWVGLVAGLIIGWIIEWIIDWYFWRQESLQALLSDDQARQQLREARKEIEDLRAQLAQAGTAPIGPTSTERASDPLSRINGVGNVYAARLNEAGIYTFSDVAQSSPEHLRDIIQPAEWQAVDFESWIEQAAALAQDSLHSSKGA